MRACIFDGVLVGKEGPASQTVVLEDASGHQTGGCLDQGSSNVFLREGDRPDVMAISPLVIIPVRGMASSQVVGVVVPRSVGNVLVSA